MANESNIPTGYVVFFIAFFILIFLIPNVAVLYSDLLWFRSLGYGSVFMTVLTAKIGIFLLATLISFALISVNAHLADGEGELKRKYIAIAILSAIIGLLLSRSSWEIILKYLNQERFGVTDPVFSKDIGFYIFTLPFYRLVQNFLFFIVLSSIIAITVIYLKKREIALIKPEVVVEEDVYGIPRPEFPLAGLKIGKRAKAHIYVLLGIFFLLLSLRNYLDRFDVLYSKSGVIFGAGYADINALLPVLSLLVFISMIAAILFLTSSVLTLTSKIEIRGLLIAIVAVYILALLGTGLYPGVIQQYRVLPNEISMEREYIERNIEYTRNAYGLNDIREIAFTPNENMSMEHISKNWDIIRNIRLWDWRPLKQTYKQMQEIRSYYEFNDVDVDRYTIENEYTQVMLSPREMDYEQLSEEAKTWVNRHILYTHGYGICMSPVNRFTGEGLPEFFVKDIPPRSEFKNLVIKRPEIYYGERTDQFIVVKTTTEEFDYPRGDENEFTTYNGTGGIELNSFVRRLIMSIRFGDINLILSHYITPESRILFNRNIHQRVREIAPFLLYDPDPYVVTVDGKIYWIQDAYTYTDRYPYATPYENLGINYIRNSVKVVIDAYNGNTIFYVIDSGDPLIKTYMNIFPNLFRKFEEMPDGLKKHIRYPEVLFKIQTNVYGVYHMTDPTVFYNKEDKWVIPHEKYGHGTRQEMAPYYIITQLPEEKDLEFILMIPLTPKNKDNMIAWMGAKCDGDYGKLIIYKFPKEKLIYGPMQIEARIDQDDQISQQLTLWSQYGSDVIRGNILVIPVGDTLLYVEPLYIKAEQATMPELKRVIVSYGSRVVMEKNLNLAFSRLFGMGTEEIRPGGVENKSIGELVDLALEHFNSAQTYIREGNWTGFGEELEKLERTLIDMKNVTRY
ncbi:MAG: hypothetical protein B6U86_00080 [Candidatus Altiarchaeales archaeon ex4484_43]|nr:MAG: hypothetical protein B6U86_00080 [Candidatus Altiarchaeales archaeon ex4484_43]